MSDGFDVDGVIGRAATPADAVGVPAEWARLRRPILGEADAVMDPAEARDLVAEFRRVRDRHRGAFVAPAAELLTDPVRIATAYLNLAGASEITLNDLIELVGEVAGSPVKVDPAPKQAGDSFRNGGAIGRARDVLGWAPHVSLRDGITAQIAWHRARS